MGRALKKSKSARFVGLPHVVVESHSYLSLGFSAKSLLIDLVHQYNGYNNGDLTAAYGHMKKRGWRSKQTLAKALRELLAAELIIKTRHGQFRNPHACCDLYAVTWQPIDECRSKNLHVAPSVTPPRKFSLEQSKIPNPENGLSTTQKVGRARSRDARGRYISTQKPGRLMDCP